MIDKDQYYFIRNHPAFENLSIDTFDRLASQIQYRKTRKNQILFYEGDERRDLYLIYEGYVRIEEYDQTDRFSYIDYIKKGSVFPYGGLFKDGFYHYTAVAIDEVEYFKIPTKLFEELSQRHIKQMTFLARKLSSILEFQELRLRNMVSGSATERVVQAISLLYVDLCAEDENQLPFPVSVKELARLSATTRETAAKVLKTLQDDYRIRYQQKILVILDKDYFLQYVQ